MPPGEVGPTQSRATPAPTAFLEGVVRTNSPGAVTTTTYSVSSGTTRSLATAATTFFIKGRLTMDRTRSPVGAGTDAIDYRKRTTSVDVTFNGIPDDGDSDENDDVAADVEIGYGGKADDKLRGNQAKNVFFGGAGPDSLNGEGGADRLFGNGGNDSLNGGPASDDCSGGAGTDTVRNCE